jgi:hypothetical protein
MPAFIFYLFSMEKLIAFALTAISFLGNAQGLFLNDYRMAGKPLLATSEGMVNGTPYLNSEWGRGFVYVNEKVKSDEVMIRFDIFNKCIELQDASGNIFMLDPQKIRGCKFATTVDGETENFVFENSFQGITDFPKTEYFEVVLNGRSKFLKHYSKNLVSDPGAYGATKSKSLADEVKYFVIQPNGDVLAFGDNKKSLLRAFSTQEMKISEFLKQEKIKLSDRAQVSRLFSFIDALDAN